MSNMQFYFALGVPFLSLVLMYLAGILSNRAAINDLRSEMRSGFTDIGQRIDRIEKRLETIDTEIRINQDHRVAVEEARVLGLER